MERHLSARHFASVHGRRIAYRIAGDPAGSPIVLLHALASHSGTWNQVASALAALGFRVIAPDLRGHGGSDWANSYALAEFGDDLAGLLDALRLERVDLIGHSLGGHLALRLAARAPRRVGRIVIEAAPVPPRDAADAAGMQARPNASWRQRALRASGMARIVRRVVLCQFDLRAAGPVLREVRAPMPLWWRELGAIHSHVLLLAGRNDGAISGRIELLSARLLRPQTAFIGDGHHLHGEHHREFMAAVSPFLLAGSSSAIAQGCNGRMGELCVREPDGRPGSQDP